MKEKKKSIKYIALTIVMSLSMLATAGCGNERQEDEDAFRQIGINCMEEGDYEGAIAAFDSALSRRIGSVREEEIDINYYKASAQYLNGDIAGAIATYTTLIEYDEKLADAYYQRGCRYLDAGDVELALADFSNAVNYNATDYELYVLIYQNLTGYDKVQEGQEYLNKAFNIKGDSAENHMWRGRIYYFLGEYENAATELTLAVDGDNIQAMLYLAQVYDAQGDSEKAANYYEAYVASGTADSAAMNALGEIAMSNGDYAGAVSYLEQGLNMENVSNRRNLLKNLVIAYEYTGNFTSAWNTIQEYVESYPEDTEAAEEYIFLKYRQTNAIDETEDAAESTENVEGTETEQSTEEVDNTENQ